MKTKAIVSLSGGMDSATVLADALAHDRECSTVGMVYGSKHNEYEQVAAKSLADHYKVPYRLIDWSSVAVHLRSNLLKSGGEIPEGHYEEKNMAQTVVPGRNLIFLSILAGIAWTEGASEIWFGAHSGDHLIYPDCRPSFFHSMNDAIFEGTDGKVKIVAPFIDGNKTSIIALGYKLGVPYQLTRTCYKDQAVACGKCGSCQERLEAFHNNGLKDPIEYETRELMPKHVGT